MSLALVSLPLPPRAEEVMGWCLLHFVGLDEANAAIHTAPVRYSPITFRLAELLEDDAVESDVLAAARRVLSHRGLYEEDKGR